MNTIQVNVVKMYPDVIVPEYQTEGSAGCDVCAYLPKEKFPSQTVNIFPEKTLLIPTGLKFSIPEGFELQIRPRSGLSLKTKVRIANSPGTLDCDYRGELGIIIDNINHERHDNSGEVITEVITITHGDRIAQLVFAPIVHASLTIVDSLDETQRGSGGFGSTGK